MKKFTLTVLCAATFFLGLGGLMENVGARLKSDERALEIVRLARQAIGGDANINGVQSLSARGKITKTLNLGDEARVESGDWELNLQSPNKISRLIKLGAGSGGDGAPLEKKVNVVVVRKGDGAPTVIDGDAAASDKITILKKGDGTMPNAESGTTKLRRQILTEDIRGAGENRRGDELFRTMMFLLLNAPQNSDASYIYAGDATIDGINCEAVEINSSGGSVKIFFNKSTHFPVMASFTATKPLVLRFKADDANGGDVKPDVRVLADAKSARQTGEFQIKFSDYRNVNGVQMPFRWTQTIDGAADETIDVTTYEINPANIAEKFKNDEPQKITLRMKKPE